MGTAVSAQLVTLLRALAHEGRSPAEMFVVARSWLGDRWHIVDVIRHFRDAFCLSLGEAKPLCGFPRDPDWVISDAPEPILDELLAEAIRAHWNEWNLPSAE
jgi:hypothetical protein